jgi:hypothetical protein
MATDQQGQAYIPHMHEQTTRAAANRKPQNRAPNYGPRGSPPHPIDTAARRPDEDNMELRIARLEGYADECRRDIRTVDVLLAKIETVTDGLARNAATKADVAQLESTLIKWLIGTATALAGLAFAAAKLMH